MEGLCHRPPSFAFPLQTLFIGSSPDGYVDKNPNDSGSLSSGMAGYNPTAKPELNICNSSCRRRSLNIKPRPLAGGLTWDFGPGCTSEADPGSQWGNPCAPGFPLTSARGSDQRRWGCRWWWIRCTTPTPANKDKNLNQRSAVLLHLDSRSWNKRLATRFITQKLQFRQILRYWQWTVCDTVLKRSRFSYYSFSDIIESRCNPFTLCSSSQKLDFPPEFRGKNEL